MVRREMAGRWVRRVAAGAFVVACVVPAFGDAFSGYAKVGTTALPAGAGPFDALEDGRVVTLVGDDVWVESSSGSGAFSLVGTIPAADLPSFGAAFVRVSPPGTRIAIGNNGGASFSSYKVGVFIFPALTGTWFTADHFDAAWTDETHLAVTAGDFVNPSIVTVLDVTSPNPGAPTNITVVDGIGGASAGVAFDAVGNLYTGNGFTTSGPSGTGAVKAFLAADWLAALGGGPALDFETEGILVVDSLSASPLGFDAEGNLFIGGGDFSDNDETGYVALVRASAVQAAIAGQGSADTADPSEVRRFDPDTANDFNFYAVTFSPGTTEILVRDGSTDLIHRLRDVTSIPTVSAWGASVIALLLMTAGTVLTRRVAPS